jgi:transposase
VNKKYIARLTPEEREDLSRLITKGKAAAYKIRHAHMLLKADADGPAWTDERIAESFSSNVNTVAAVRKRFVEEGLEAAVHRKKQVRPSRPLKLDGEKQARLIALRCGKPPEERGRWSLRLLADKAVELQIVESISHETVRRSLKKTSSSPTCASTGSFRRSKTGSL